MTCQTITVLGGNLTFGICTHDPDAMELSDADAAPIYRVYEDETGVPILTGTMTVLDNPNTLGFYTEQIACTTVNGFEIGKSYTIYIEAVVNGYTGGITYGFTVIYDIVALLSNTSITIVSAVDGNKISVYNYADWEFTIQDAAIDLSDATANGVFFAVKELLSHTDSASKLQVQEGVGIKYINGVLGAGAVIGKGILTVLVGEDGISVDVNASVTGFSANKQYFWEIKKITVNNDEAKIVARGYFSISDAVMRGLGT